MHMHTCLSSGTLKLKRFLAISYIAIIAEVSRINALYMSSALTAAFLSKVKYVSVGLYKSAGYVAVAYLKWRLFRR